LTALAAFKILFNKEDLGLRTPEAIGKIRQIIHRSAKEKFNYFKGTVAPV
jgi:hypothetical protein